MRLVDRLRRRYCFADGNSSGVMRIVKRAGFVLAGGAIAMLAASAVSFDMTRDFLRRSQRTSGTVAELVPARGRGGKGGENARGPCYPVVRFRTAGGEEVDFVAAGPGRPSRWRRGRTVRVRYERGNPLMARIDGFSSLWGAGTALGALGLALGAAGAVLAAAGLRSESRDRWVRDSGKPVSTEFHTVTRSGGAALAGRRAYRIVTRWRDPNTGVHHTFQSGDIYFDPESHASVRPIVVRIDPANPKRYWMDTTFLPEWEEAPPAPPGGAERNAGEGGQG